MPYRLLGPEDDDDREHEREDERARGRRGRKGWYWPVAIVGAAGRHASAANVGVHDRGQRATRRSRSSPTTTARRCDGTDHGAGGARTPRSAGGLGAARAARRAAARGSWPAVADRDGRAGRPAPRSRVEAFHKRAGARHRERHAGPRRAAGAYAATLPLGAPGLWELRFARDARRASVFTRDAQPGPAPRAPMTALIASVLGASLLGSAHCAGMCGGFVAFYAGGAGALRGARRGAATSPTTAGGSSPTSRSGARGRRCSAPRSNPGGVLLGVQRAAAIVAGVLMIALGRARRSSRRSACAGAARRAAARSAALAGRGIGAVAARAAAGSRALAVGLATGAAAVRLALRLRGHRGRHRQRASAAPR